MPRLLLVRLLALCVPALAPGLSVCQIPELRAATRCRRAGSAWSAWLPIGIGLDLP